MPGTSDLVGSAGRELIAQGLGQLLEAIRGASGAEVVRALAAELVPGAITPDERVLALGWASVDAQRAIREAGSPPSRPTVRDALLGCGAWAIPGDTVGMLILEPDTEGRLAAFLARRGEGPCAVYVEAPGASGSLRPTALGWPGRLRPHERPWGPFIVAVAIGG